MASDPASTPVPNAAASTVNGQQQALTAGAALGGAATREGDTQAAAAAAAAAASAAGPAEAAAAAELAAAAADTEEGNTAFLDALAEASPAVAAAAVAATARAVAAAAAAAPVAELERVVDSTSSNSTAAAAQNAYLRLRASRRNPQTTGLAADSKDAAVQLLQQHSTRHSSSLAGDDIVTLVLRLRQQQQEQQALFALEARRQQSQARLSYLLALQQRQQHVRQLRAHLTECRHLLLRIADHTIGELQQESAAAAAAGSSSSSSSSSSSAARAVCVFEGLGGVSALVDIATGAASLPAGLLSRAAPAVVTQIKELLHVVLSESFYLLREFVLSHQAVAEQLGHHTGLLRCLLSCLVCPAVCDAAELLLEELIAPGDSPLSLHFCSPSWLAAAVAAEPSSPTAAAATSAAITAAGGSATLLQGSWGELHVRHVALLARLLTLLIVETDERLACSNSLWLLRRPPTRRSRRCAAAAATVAAHSPGAHSQQKQADNTPQGISADGSAATSSNSSSSGTKAWSPWLLQPLGEVPRGPKETRESLSRLIEMGPLHCSSSNSSSRESSSGSSSENDAPDASIGHPSSHGRSRKHRLAGGAVLLRRQQQQQQEEANWLQRRRSRSAAALLLGRGKLQSDDEQMCEHRKAFLTPGGPCCSEGGCSSRHSSSCCACVDSNRDILLQQPQLVERLVELLRLQSIPLPGFLSGVMCGGGGPVTATTDTGDALLELLNNSNVPLFDLVLGEPAGSRSTRGQHASRRTSSGQARAAPRSSAAAAVGGGGGAAAAGPGRRSSSNNTAVELRGALDGRAMAFASRLGLPYTRRRPRGIPDGGPTAVDASSGGRVNTSISAAAAAHPYAAPANAAAAVARRDAADESRGGQRTPLLQRLTAALSFFGAEGQQASAAPPAASAAADNGSSSSRQLGALGEWGDAASAGFVGEGAGAAGAPAEAAAGAVTNSATEGTQFRGFMEEVIAAAAADGIAVGEPDLLGAPDDLDALAAAVAGPGEVSIGIEFLAPVSIPEQQQQHDQPLSSLEDAAATAAASAATARQSAADAAAAAEAVEFASDAIRGVAEEPPAASRAVWTVSALVGSQQQQQQQQQQQRTLVHVLLEPADGTEDPDASLGWFNMTPQQRRDLLPQQQQQPQQDTETLQQELQTQQQQQQAMLVVQRHLLLHNQQGLGTQDELQLRQLFNRTHQLYRQHRAALKRRNRRRKRNPQHHSSSSSSSSSRSLAAASPPSGAAGGLGPDEGQAEQEDQQRQQQQQQDQQQDSTFMGRLLRRLSTLSFGVSRSHEAVAAAEDAVRAAATFSLDGIQGGGNNASAAANFPEGKQQHWLRRRRRRPSFSGSKRSRCSSSSSHRSSSGSSSSSSSEHGEPVGEPQGRRGLFAAGPPGQSAAASKRQQQQQDQGRLSRRDRYKRRKLQQRQQRRLALQGTDGFPPQPLMKTLSADEGHSSSSSNSSFMSSATEDEAAELQHLQELEIRKVASANSRASRLPLAALAPFRPSFATRSFLQQQRSQAAERSMSSSSSSSSRRGDVSTAATGRARQRGEADFAAPRLPHAERAAAAAAPAAAEQSVVLDASLPLHEQAQQVLQFYTSRSPGSPALGPSDSLQQQQEQQQQQQQQLQRQQEAVVSRSASSDSASAAEGVGDDASRLGLLSWRQWASSLWGSSRSLSDVAANAVAADTHRPRGDAAASNAAAATAATADASAAAARAPTAPERRRRLGGLRAGRIMARQQQQQQQVQQQVQLPSGGSVHDVLMAALQTLRGIVARQNSGALEFILSSVLQQIAPPAHSYVLRMSTILPHTSELYFVICSLMGGRTRAAVQRRLGRLGIVRVVGDLLEAQLWFTPDPLAHQWLPSTAEQQQQQQQQDNGTEEGLRGDGNCAGSSNSSSNNGSEGDEGEGAPPSCRPTANAEAWSEGPPVRRRRHSSNTAQSTNVFNSSSSSSNSSSNSSIGSRNSSSNASSTIYRATGAAFDTSLSALPPPPASSERLCCCETSLCSFALELLRLIHDLGDYESGPVAAELRREMLTAHERNIVMHALRAPRRVDLRPPLIRAVRQRLRVIHPHPLVDPDKHRRSAAATSSNNNNNSSSSSSSRRSSSAGMAMDTQPQEQRTEARAAQVEDSTASPAASESSQQEPQESRQRRAGAAASDGTSSSNSSSSTSSGETAGTHRSSEQFGRIATRYIFKGTAGLLCRLICIYGHEPPSSLYKFWLASSIEACIRGSDPLIKVFAAESGLLQILLSDMHAIALEQRRLQNKQEEQGSAALPAAVEMLQEGGAVSDSNSSSSNGSSSSSSAAQRGMLQSCCDLLGELLKFNPYVLLLLDRHFARDPAALAVFTSTIEDNLIDTNVLVRSLYLTAELCRQTARVHTLAAASEVLKLPQGPADACAVDQQVEAAAAVAAAAAAAAAADAAAEGRELLREHRYLPLWRQMHFFDRNSSSPITLHGSQEEEEKQQRQQGQSCLSKGMPHDSDSCCATGGFAAPTGLTIPFADGGSLRKLLRRFQNSSSRLLANDNSSCSSSRFLASDCSSSSSSEAIVDALGLSGGNPAGKSDQLSHAGGEQLLFPQQHQQQQQQDEDVCYWDLAPLGIGLRPDPSPAMVASVLQGSRELHAVFSGKYRADVSLLLDPEKSPIAKFITERRTEILKRLMCAVSFEGVVPDSICCVNTSLVLLLLTLLDGQLPETLREIKQQFNKAEAELAASGSPVGVGPLLQRLIQGDRSHEQQHSLQKREEPIQQQEEQQQERKQGDGVQRQHQQQQRVQEDTDDRSLEESMGVGAFNFWRLLHFWRVHYMRRRKDARGLEFASQIPLHYWHELVTILCGPADEPTSLAYRV